MQQNDHSAIIVVCSRQIIYPPKVDRINGQSLSGGFCKINVQSARERYDGERLHPQKYSFLEQDTSHQEDKKV